MAVNTKSVLSDSAVDLMNQAVIVSGQTVNRLDNYATIRQDDQASSISFTVFSRLSVATTALTDGTEASSTSMTDTKVTATLAEYGNVITTTSLANVATAGKADLAGAELVGINMGETMEALGLGALEAGSNTISADTAGTLDNLDLREAYTELADAGIQKFQDGRYVAFVNPAQVSDIKGDYIPIAQNTDLNMATMGVVGSLEGFTIVESPLVTAGKVVCFGRNALGKAVGRAGSMVLKEGNDNLGRTYNMGWYFVGKYLIIDENAVRVITGA